LFSHLFSHLFSISSKDLADWVEQRGLVCKGCVEKEDYVKLVWENKDVPVKEKPAETKSEEASDDKKYEDIEKLMEQVFFFFCVLCFVFF
jgi:hypothetical protein